MSSDVSVGRSCLRRATLAFAMVALGICFTQTAQAIQETRTIGKIEFVGLKGLNPDELIAASGLRIGQAFDLKALDDGAQKLADSGLFKNISYRTQTVGNSVTITFVVEGSKGGNSPVLFDNFVWFTDEELNQALRREVPSFNGTAPNAGEMINSITAALQKLLVERNIKGSVEYLPSQDSPGAAAMQHIFSVSGSELRVCAIHFPGAQNISETKLKKASSGLVNNEYSRKFSGLFASKNLLPLYREVGQLRATFLPPIAIVSVEPKCKGGVDLTIPVDERAVYVWEKAEWRDNNVLSSETLDKELGMKSAEVANGLKIDSGLAAVRAAYGRRGYLERRLMPLPEFDEIAHRVTYKITVKEGPQYRMGNLSFKGFSESGEKQLRKRWKLKAGAPYDEEFVGEFIKKATFDLLGSGSVGTELSTSVRPNRETLMVDVYIEVVKPK